MSFCNFLIFGIGESVYQRNSYPSEPKTEIIGSSNDFSGKTVVLKDDGKKKNVSLDNTVKITTFADKIFKDARNFWKLVLAGSVLTCVVSAILTTTLLVGGVALGILFPSFGLVAVLVTSAATIPLGIIFLSGLRSKMAAGELSLWTDPLKQIIKRRKEIPSKDFDTLITQKKYKTLLSDEEFKKFWEHSKSNYTADQILKNQDLKQFLAPEEIKQLWKENKSNYTFNEILQNPELEELASDKDLKKLWIEEIRHLKQTADSLEEGGIREKGGFVRTLYKNAIFSERFYSCLYKKAPPESGVTGELTHFEKYLLFAEKLSTFNVSCVEIDNKISGEKAQTLRDAFYAVKQEEERRFKDSTPNNAWYNTSVATSRLHAAALDLKTAYNRFEKTRAYNVRAKEIYSNASYKALLAELNALDDFGKLFSSAKNLLEEILSAL